MAGQPEASLERAPVRVAPTGWRNLLRFSIQHRSMRFGLGIVGAWVLVALLAPVIAPYSPTLPHPGAVLVAPGSHFLLGTDNSGLDILSRILWAPRTDLGIAAGSAAAALIVGVPLGAFTGYFAGRRHVFGILANVLMRCVDVSQAFPVFVFALAIVAVLGPQVINVMLALAFVNTPVFVWLTRAQMLQVRDKPFVEAARCGGNSELRLAFRHVLPNALVAPLTQVSVVLGFCILLTASLSFVGAGVRQPTPEWGLMVAQGADDMITGQWWVALFPGLALASAVFGFGLIGDGLRVYLDPKQRREVETQRRRSRDKEGTRRQRKSGRGATVVRTEETDRSERLSRGVLDIEHLEVRYHTPDATTTVLDDVSLTLAPGATLGIVGKSGAGKSVLARTIMGLIRSPAEITRGSVRLDGREVVGAPEELMRPLRGSEMSLIVANPRSRLNPVLSVGAQLVNVVVARHPEMDKAASEKRVSELLDSVAIGDPDRVKRLLPQELSGGMCQRVIIAMAVAGSPRLIVADEPTSGLDVTVQRQVLELLMGLVKEHNTAVLLMTRDLGIIAHYAQSVAVLAEGRVVEQRPVAEFFDAPEHPHSRELVVAGFAARGKSIE